ncbi:MAG: Sua5/YciO/YrdC/YwlC family protein [Byssovorax sp.]
MRISGSAPTASPRSTIPPRVVTTTPSPTAPPAAPASPSRARCPGIAQLLCDAHCEAAVMRLRARKRREEKPLAVMVPDLPAARALAMLDALEEEALRSAAGPIVLVRRRGEDLAPSIAPENARIGLLLPTTPLHHRLLRRLDFPVVCTSGNLHDEPIAMDDDDALVRLGLIADRPFRGLGIVPRGGLRLREAYARWDAERRFDLAMKPIEDEEPGRCRAAEVLQGLLAPTDCPEFGRGCTPESPLGAPMVSTEGACAAYFRYRRVAR